MNKRTGGWMQALFTLVFIITPALVMWVFLTKDWQKVPPLNFGLLFLTQISFLLYAILIVWIFIKLDFCYYDIYNAVLPMALVMIAINLSAEQNIWLRAGLVLGCVILALPINIVVNKITESQNRQEIINKNK